MAYVLPPTLTVVDSTAEIRREVATLKNGERVEVLARARNWVRIRLPDGPTGWVQGETLLDSQTYEAGQKLLNDMSRIPPQAVGHTTSAANFRLAPSRDAPVLWQAPANQKVELMGRRLVERPPTPERPAVTEPVREAWYLVRADSKAGWMLGRLVELDVPEEISTYAQSMNMVAWLVLNTVEDNGRQVPQYLVADRLGTQEFDFNHVRVFTWWAKRQEYVTAYVERGVNGYFPLIVRHLDNVPYFRLRLVDKEGRKFQKVYGLFDTITRPLGIVEGWESEAMPTRPAPKPRRVRPPRR